MLDNRDELMIELLGFAPENRESRPGNRVQDRIFDYHAPTSRRLTSHSGGDSRGVAFPQALDESVVFVSELGRTTHDQKYAAVVIVDLEGDRTCPDVFDEDGSGGMVPQVRGEHSERLTLGDVISDLADLSCECR